MEKKIGFIGLGAMGKWMALANGFGDEGKGAMIKVFERILDTKFRKQKEGS